MCILPNCHYCGKFLNPNKTEEVGSYHYPHGHDHPGDPFYYHWNCMALHFAKRAKQMQPVPIKFLKIEGFVL